MQFILTTCATWKGVCDGVCFISQESLLTHTEVLCSWTLISSWVLFHFTGCLQPAQPPYVQMDLSYHY